MTGTGNPHWSYYDSNASTVYILKSFVHGYPYDRRSFDQNYVYNVSTEYVWSNPYTYKAFESPLVWGPACVTIPQSPGKIWSFKTPSSGSWFDIHDGGSTGQDCSSYTAHSLGYVKTELWYDVLTLGGSLSANNPALVTNYYYNGDSTYSTFNDKEVFVYMLGWGTVEWTHYTWSGTAWVQQSQAIFNQVNYGTVAPVYHPCW